MSISLTAAAAGLVWPLKMVSEAPVSTDQIWTWDKMIKLVARLEESPPRRPQHHKWHRRRPDWRRDDSNHNQRENLHLQPKHDENDNDTEKSWILKCANKHEKFASNLGSMMIIETMIKSVSWRTHRSFLAFRIPASINETTASMWAYIWIGVKMACIPEQKFPLSCRAATFGCSLMHFLGFWGW